MRKTEADTVGFDGKWLPGRYCRRCRKELPTVSDELTMERLNIQAALADVYVSILSRTLEDIASTEAAFPLADDLNEIGGRLSPPGSGR